MRTRIAAAFVLYVVSIVSLAADYVVTDLGTLPCDGCSSSGALAINDAGTIAGHVQVPDCSHAALYQNGAWRDLGALGIPPGLIAGSSQASDINGIGQVVGYSQTSDDPGPDLFFITRAFIWDESTGMRDLGSLGRFRSCRDVNGEQVCFTVDHSEATGINDDGVVVGTTSTADSGQRAFIWDAGSGMRELERLPGWTSTRAVGINNRGEVIGFGGGPGTPSGAFIWSRRNGIRLLGSLDKNHPVVSTPSAINDLGEVVGWGVLLEGENPYTRAFIWRKGVMKALPPLAGHQFSQAFGLNDRGQVVGVSGSCNPDSGCVLRPVLWDGDQMIDIGSIEQAGKIPTARGINNRGLIVGESDLLDEEFATHGFLAEPH